MALESHEIQEESPEFVYYNLPARFGPLVITAPNKYINLHCNSEAEPSAEGISVKMKNNGAWGRYKHLNNNGLLEQLKFFIPSDIHDTLVDLTKSVFADTPRDKFLEFISQILGERYREIFRERIDNVLAKEGTVYPHSFEAKMEIEGVFYKEKYVPFDEISSLEEEIEQDMEIFKSLCKLEKGDYLYRAVDKNEWRDILRDGIYLIRDNTNFEDKIGPQVQNYANHEDYSGKIIRIKMAGSYFRNAGMAVRRITSLAPHFAEVEILADNEWLSVQDYKEREFT